MLRISNYEALTTNKIHNLGKLIQSKSFLAAPQRVNLSVKVDWGASNDDEPI